MAKDTKNNIIIFSLRMEASLYQRIKEILDKFNKSAKTFHERKSLNTFINETIERGIK